MRKWVDNQHRIKVVYFESSEEYDLEIIHVPSCKIWKGCPHRGEEDHQFVANPGIFGNCCPSYAHAHFWYECPIGYLEGEIGIKDTLGLDKYHGTEEWLERTFQLFKVSEGKELAIHYTFIVGTSYEGEYNEEFEWGFRVAS